MRKWQNVELPKETAGRFKEYLRDMHIPYEASEAYNLIHFEVYVDATEAANANVFLEERC